MYHWKQIKINNYKFILFAIKVYQSPSFKNEQNYLNNANDHLITFSQISKNFSLEKISNVLYLHDLLYRKKIINILS